MTTRPMTRRELDERYARGEIDEKQYGRLLLETAADEYDKTAGDSHDEQAAWVRRSETPSAGPGRALGGSPTTSAAPRMIALLAAAMAILVAGAVVFFATARQAAAPTAVPVAPNELAPAPTPVEPAKAPEAASAGDAVPAGEPAAPQTSAARELDRLARPAGNSPPEAPPTASVELPLALEASPPARSKPLIALDRNVIRRVVRERQGAIRTCYEQQLRSHPGLSGRIDVEFAIEQTGEVGSCQTVRDTLSTSAVADCVCAQIRRWRFPPHEAERPVTVTYPFTFSAR
jgi:hypothetical protein